MVIRSPGGLSTIAIDIARQYSNTTFGIHGRKDRANWRSNSSVRAGVAIPLGLSTLGWRLICPYGGEGIKSNKIGDEAYPAGREGGRERERRVDGL